MRVAGQVNGALAPTVSIDGNNVQVGPDGRFLADVAVTPGLFTMQTLVDDANGTAEDLRALLVDADADPKGEVANAVQVAVSRDGLLAISRLVSAAIGNLDLAGLLGGNAQLADGIEVRGITYQSVELELTPGNGVLELRLRIYGLRIDIRGEVNILIVPVRLSGRATSNPAEIVARLNVRATPEGGLDVSIASAEAHLHDFGLDLDGVPGIIEDLVDSVVREFAEDEIGKALREVVVPSLFDPAALSQQLDVLGTQLQLDMKMRDVRIDPGALTLSLAAKATAPQTLHQGGAVRTVPGAPTTHTDDIDLALAAGFVSRIMHAAWSAGVLDLTLDENAEVELPLELTVGVLANILGSAAEGIDPTTPLVIRTRALLPPVASIQQGDNPLLVEVGDLMLEFATRDETLLVVALQLRIGVGLSFEAEATPSLTVEARADVAESPRGPVDDVAVERGIAAFAALIPNLVAGGAEAEGADVLPAPIPLDGASFAADEFAPYLHVLVGLGP